MQKIKTQRLEEKNEQRKILKKEKISKKITRRRLEKKKIKTNNI